MNLNLGVDDGTIALMKEKYLFEMLYIKEDELFFDEWVLLVNKQTCVWIGNIGD